MRIKRFSCIGDYLSTQRMFDEKEYEEKRKGQSRLGKGLAIGGVGISGIGTLVAIEVPKWHLDEKKKCKNFYRERETYSRYHIIRS